MTGFIKGFISTQSLVDAAYIAQRSGCPFQQFEQFFRRMLRHLNLGGFNYSTIMDAFNHFSGDSPSTTWRFSLPGTSSRN
ncbi:MAG: hypothetical protein IJS62_06865 [Bacteroidales bacterium]|nr:hypothetical protein [Bacteroidales bacterium]